MTFSPDAWNRSRKGSFINRFEPFLPVGFKQAAINRERHILHNLDRILKAGMKCMH